MARLPRSYSELGFMHLITRGIGKQVLFEEKDDFVYYLSLLKRYSSDTNVTICAYCLMENHVHLLTFDKEHNVPLFMKKIGVTYSGYFNKKYERTGHLFQDRYLSEVIESEDYLVTVFRYILNNPQKAGICTAAEYEWSSYRQYGSRTAFVDTSVLERLIGSKEEYASYIAAKNEDICLEFNSSRKNDEWAKSIIHNELNLETGTKLQSFDKTTRNKAIKVLKEKGLSINQIERLTGISRNIIQRA